MRATTLVLVALLGACEGRHAAPRRARATAATGALAPVVAADDAVPSLPAPPRLTDELASHESLTACRDRVRGSLAPDLAELLGDLGYQTAPDDVCSALAAVRSGDARACDSLSVSAVRNGCRRRVAVAHGAPDACPNDPVVEGREPTCLAWASRDPALCRAANDADAPRCRAVLANDPSGCRDSIDADSCARDVHRFGSLLAREPGVRPASDVAPPTFTVTLTGTTETIEADGTSSVVHGVTVTTCGGLARFTLGRHGRTDPVPYFVESPTPFLEVAARPGDEGRGERIPLGGPTARASLSIVLPRAASATSELGAAANVTHEPVRLVRGSIIAGAVDGTLASRGGTVRITGRFRTFLRDVIEQAPPCGP